MKPHNYGVLSLPDVPYWEMILRLVNGRFPAGIHMLEIGVAGGGTTRGTLEYCQKNGFGFSWTGLDQEIGRPSFDLGLWGRFIAGNFQHADVFNQLEDSLFNLIFIDGCHCYECCVKDFVIYSERLVRDGFCVFHDTNPSPEWQNHHVQCQPDRKIETRRALADMNLLPCTRPDYTFLGEQALGTTQGMALYQKIVDWPPQRS